MRETVWVGRHGLRRDDAHQLPVTGGGVLPLRALEEPAGHRGSTRLWWTTLERLDVAETQGLEIRQVQPPDGFRHVSQRVRAFVSIVARVGQGSCADGIEHDHAGARHVAILGRSWQPPWG